MSEIRDILHERHHQMAASLSDAGEFDHTAAVRAIRTHRRSRALVTGASAVATVAVVVTGAWLTLGSSEPAVVPVGVPSTSASPTPAASPSAAVTPSPEPVAYDGRNPNMSDEEALYRAEHPATGEEWFDEPVKVAAPAGATTDASAVWWSVGESDDGGILVVESWGDLTFVEVGGDGSAMEVVSPFAHHALATLGRTGLPISDAYYDSLSVPTSWTAENGVELRLREPLHYAYGATEDRLSSLCEGCGGAESARVATFGRTGVLRVVEEGPYNSMQNDTPVSMGDAFDHRVVDVAYALELPFGAVLPLRADPLGTAAARAASAEVDEYGMVTNGIRDYVELDDRFCGPDLDWMSLGVDEDPAHWVPTTVLDGLEAFRATTANPLTRAFYESSTATFPDQVTGLSLEEYATQPAIIGAPTADGSGWWLEIDQRFSLRNGC